MQVHCRSGAPWNRPLGWSGRPPFRRANAQFRGKKAAADLAETGPQSDLSQPGRRDDTLARVEAILFLAREPLNTRKIAQFASLADGTQARTLIRVLNQFYDQGGSAFRVEEVAGGFQLFTRAALSPWLRRLHRVEHGPRLSGPSLETLAVVAYRQPIPRSEVEAVRGVQCGDLLRQLMERDLVRIVGRSEELGRPFLYGTTKRFLEQFGLRRLEDLPASELRVAGGKNTPELSPGRSRLVHTNFSQDCEEEESL